MLVFTKDEIKPEVTYNEEGLDSNPDYMIKYTCSLALKFSMVGAKFQFS